MATSIGQYAPVFLPGEPLSLTAKPGKPQSTGSKRVGHYRSHPECLDIRHFFACGSSAPVGVECERCTAAWLAGTLAVPSVQGHGLPLLQELWPYESLFFQASCSLQSEGLFGQSFTIAPPIQALRGLPYLGSFSVVRASGT